jgi:hypothetical protein
MFPGVNGIANALANYIPQVDRDGTPFKVLPPVWADERDLTGWETDPTYLATLNRPFQIDDVGSEPVQRGDWPCGMTYYDPLQHCEAMAPD